MLSPRVLTILAIFASAGLSGCAQNTATVVRRTAVAGYAIWYPAESGIEPGQVWLYDGTLESKFADRPSAVAMSSDPIDINLHRKNDIKGTLKSDFTEAAISNAGPFSAELWAGSVRSGTYIYGPTQTKNIDLANVYANRAKYGPAYATALQLVRDDKPGVVLIASVVQTQWVDYTLMCEDPYKLIDRLPRIRNMVHAEIDAKVTDVNQVKLRLTPVKGWLTIGVTPVRGQTLTMSTDDARKALTHELLLAKKQSYALRVPIPKTVMKMEGPLVKETDTADGVASKYTKATTPEEATTLPSTRNSTYGGVVMPTAQTRPSTFSPKY